MEGKDICFFTVIQCFLKDFTILALRKWKVVSSLTLTVGDFFLSGSHFGIWRLLHIWEKSSFMDLMFSFLTLKISKNFEFVFKIFQPTCRPKKKKKKREKCSPQVGRGKRSEEQCQQWCRRLLAAFIIDLPTRTQNPKPQQISTFKSSLWFLLTGQPIEELRLHYHIIAGTHFWEEHYGRSNNAADVKTAFVIISSKAKSIALKNQVEFLLKSIKVWMLVVCLLFFFLWICLFYGVS